MLPEAWLSSPRTGTLGTLSRCGEIRILRLVEGQGGQGLALDAKLEVTEARRGLTVRVTADSLDRQGGPENCPQEYKSTSRQPLLWTDSDHPRTLSLSFLPCPAPAGQGEGTLEDLRAAWSSLPSQELQEAEASGAGRTRVGEENLASGRVADQCCSGAGLGWGEAPWLGRGRCGGPPKGMSMF